MNIENGHAQEIAYHKTRIAKLREGNKDGALVAAQALIDTVRKWTMATVENGTPAFPGQTYIGLGDNSHVSTQGLNFDRKGNVHSGRIVVLSPATSPSSMRERFSVENNGDGTVHVHALKGRGRKVVPDPQKSADRLFAAAEAYPEAQLTLDAKRAEAQDKKPVEPGRRKMRREMAAEAKN